MRTRQQALGNRNIVGARIEQRRKELHMKQKDLLTQLQIKGVDLNASGLSKLEGQYRFVSDIELKYLAQVLEVSVNWLLDEEDDQGRLLPG
ncbi:MAG: XRE family transcriptional regulator [Oscillospiraceae bacterium]|nr:XRE family transcriptional regulator [Oscillospiraceae bacterium]